MARTPHRPATLVRIVLLGLLLLPLLTLTPSRPAGSGAAGAAAAALGQVPPSPPPAAANGPSLRLTWAAPETHAGVPIGLAIQALDDNGRPDPGRAGTVLLLVDDDRAQVAPAGSGQTPLTGSPVTTDRAAQQVAVPLAGGAAEVVLTFATPGRHQLLATLAADPEVAGESAPLPVAGTFFAIRAHRPWPSRSGRASRWSPRTTGAHRCRTTPAPSS